MVELLESTTPNDIIIYKNDNGIVYGYFNQKALDMALYTRAKKSSNNFESKNQWEDEKGKRSASLDDISIQRHSILFRPVSEGDYISEGDIILDIGLNWLSYSNYSQENNISNFETNLWLGIRVFSCYPGFFSCKIEDNIIGSCNLGNTILDGDLLFTIELGSKPEEVNTSKKDIAFTYNLLSRKFLDSVPHLEDITVKNWLVNDYTKVKKGEDILEVTEFTHLEHRFSTTIKTPYSGLLVKKYDDLFGIKKKLQKGDSLFIIYSDESKIKENYPNVITVTKDDFTKTVTIVGYKCAGNTLGFNMGSIYLNFENADGKNCLLLRFNRRDINLNKKCSLHFLLDDDSVITLNAIANPVKENASTSIAKYQLSQDDIIKLETKKLIKWQITNEDGLTIKVGNNICCLDSNDTTILTQNLSYEIFQDFIKDFNKTVKENISKDKQKEADKTDSNNIVKGCCYVYLMIDTTNNFYKIGISNHPKYREHTLQSDKPTIELLCAKKFPSRTIAEAIESALHRSYANKRIRGEWFNLDASDIEDIKHTLK